MRLWRVHEGQQTTRCQPKKIRPLTPGWVVCLLLWTPGRNKQQKIEHRTKPGQPGGLLPTPTRPPPSIPRADGYSWISALELRMLTIERLPLASATATPGSLFADWYRLRGTQKPSTVSDHRFFSFFCKQNGICSLAAQPGPRNEAASETGFWRYTSGDTSVPLLNRVSADADCGIMNTRRRSMSNIIATRSDERISNQIEGTYVRACLIPWLEGLRDRTRKHPNHSSSGLVASPVADAPSCSSRSGST